MSKLKRAGLSVRVISLVLALASLAVVLGFVAPKPVDALNCGTDTYYFSDASHTVTVGERWWTTPHCGCQFLGWGSTSPYSQTFPSDC